MSHLPSLLESTFVHGQGIGPTTEQRLWQAGARTWSDYLECADTVWPLTRVQRSVLTPVVRESKARLEAQDYAWFASRLPQTEHWRAVQAFGNRLAFLDIETTGGNKPGDLTVIGVYDGHQMRQYVQGQNLHDFPEVLEEAAILVTFFGTGFDVPFLKRVFPRLAWNQMHVDLCHLLKRLGYRGGLKRIEGQFGIVRQNATAGLTGWDAVRLWREYQAGKESSLEVLLAYNADDVRNMADLLAEGYRRMTVRTLIGEAKNSPEHKSS